MRIEQVEFEDGSGRMVAARLELPAETPRGIAVLAHVLDDDGSTSAERLSRGLVSGGIGVLSVDAGKEDDLDTVVARLVGAAQHLREHRWAPTLLVGHGLAGLAALAATEQLREVRAVATIGAPADPERLPRSG